VQNKVNAAEKTMIYDTINTFLIIYIRFYLLKFSIDDDVV